MRRMMEYLGLADPAEEDMYHYGEEEPAAPAAAPRGDLGPRPLRPVGPEDGIGGVRAMSSEAGGSASVTPIAGPVRTLRPGRERKVSIVEPREFADAQQIGDRLREGPVVLNVVDTDEDAVRRLVDFAAGAVFMLEGKMAKIGRGVFLLSPPNVELSEDQKRRLAEQGLYQLKA